MTPQKKRNLIIILLVLTTITILVYAFPKMISEKSFSLEGIVPNYSLKETSGFGNQEIVSFFQEITSSKDKQVISLTEIDGMINGSLLGYGSGSFLSGSVVLQSDHLIKPKPFFEGTHYQLDGVTTLIEDEKDIYKTLFNAHGDSLSYESISYSKVDEFDLIQEGESSATILLWQSLLNHYKDTWISNTTASLSLHRLFENAITSIRVLEVTKDETYVELEGPLLQFSGTVIDSTENFAGTFSFSGSDITGSIETLSAKEGTYNITLLHNNQYQASFDGVITITGNNYKTLELAGVISWPAGITMHVYHRLENRKTGTIKKKIHPKEFIDYNTIETNLLGL